MSTASLMPWNSIDPVALGGLGVEVQAVGEAAATAPLDADPEDGPLGEALVGDDLLDLDGGLFAQGHAHEYCLLRWWTREGSRTDRDRVVTSTILS